MKRVLPIVIIVLTVVLIAMATIQPNELSPAKSPEGAVQSLFAHVRAHDYKGAYSYVAKSSDADESSFASDLSGREENGREQTRSPGLVDALHGERVSDAKPRHQRTHHQFS